MATVLVTGAARGIGREFVRQYAEAGWSVIATVRDRTDTEEVTKLGAARTELVDMRDFVALEELGGRLGAEPLDLLIANAGMTTPGAMRSAEEAERFLDVLAVNSVAPTLLASVVAPSVIKASGKLVAITSHMGSIADAGSGGWLAYRASKSALNMAWKTLSAEMADKPVAVAMLHPGWVKTDMGGAGAPLSAAESVTGMRRVIDGLGPEDKGLFLDYQGKKLPW